MMCAKCIIRGIPQAPTQRSDGTTATVTDRLWYANAESGPAEVVYNGQSLCPSCFLEETGLADWD